MESRNKGNTYIQMDIMIMQIEEKNKEDQFKEIKYEKKKRR